MLRFFHYLGFGADTWSYQFLLGALTTLEISAGAFTVGLLIGGCVAAVKLHGARWAVRLANGYSTLCRAVPELLLIIILFYAGQSALNDLLASLGFNDEDIGISGFAAAIIVLGLVQGAYASEIIRGAVLAIPRGQIEAAHAFGLSGVTLFRRIILPCVLPYAIGGLANLWMSILKDSALISVVGYTELLSTARQAAGSTKMYFSFFLFTGAIYYCITLASNAAVQRIERRIRRWMPRLA